MNATTDCCFLAEAGQRFAAEVTELRAKLATAQAELDELRIRAGLAGCNAQPGEGGMMHSDNHLWLRDQVDGARAQERERQSAIVADLRAKLTAAEAERDAANRRLQTCFDRYHNLWKAGVAFANTAGSIASTEEVEAYRKLLHELMASELWSEDRLKG